MKTRSSTRSKRSWPIVKRAKHKNGTECWMVDCRIKGVGERLYYKTAAEAEAKAQMKRTERANQGLAGVSISERLRVEAMEAERQLSPYGVTLSEAVAFYLKHAKPSLKQKTAVEVVEEFLRTKEQAGRKASYLRIQRYVLANVFGKAFGARTMDAIAPSELEEWFSSQDWTLRTRRNYHLDLHNLFGFAIKRGYCVSNPLARLETPIVTAKAPGILTVEQSAAILSAAEARGGSMLPAIAIGLFCGLRSSEIERLDWRHVRLDSKTIEVTAENAKTRERRIVEMSENLQAWLAPYAQKAGPVAPGKKFDARLKTCSKAAKIEPWPHNACRHTFASMHLAQHKNAPLTASQLGHFGSTRTLLNSYRELVSPSEAAKFWALAPSDASSKVVSITSAVA